MMQIPKKHLPAVGLLGLVVIAAAAGSVVYFQYVAPPPTKCGLNPVHRLIFMTAIIKELGGFSITGAAILNQTALPSFSVSSGANLTGVNPRNYRNYTITDHSTIFGNVGDNITLYIKSINASSSGLQFAGATGHGFTIDTPVNVVPGTGTLPDNNLAWGTWYTITFQIPKLVTSTYHCTQFCSQQHPSMNGGFVAGCG